jgi:hypothetical protein
MVKILNKKIMKLCEYIYILLEVLTKFIGDGGKKEYCT